MLLSANTIGPCQPMYHQQREGVGSRGEVGGGTGGPICLAGQFMHEIIGKFDIFGSRN